LNEQDLRADLDAMEEQHTARVAEAMRKQQRSPAETAAEHALEDAAAEAELLAKELAIAKDLNRDVDAAARALADAHEQLREAKKRAFEATRRDVADIMPRRGMSFEDELRGVVEGVKERISVMGTFNPAAVRALSGGSDRQVKLLSGMDEKLKKIATNQRMYRPSFL
jgi:chromosome segregation ATPase